MKVSAAGTRSFIPLPIIPLPSANWQGNDWQGNGDKDFGQTKGAAEVSGFVCSDSPALAEWFAGARRQLLTAVLAADWVHGCVALHFKAPADKRRVTLGSFAARLFSSAAS